MFKIINYSEYYCTTKFLDMVTFDKTRHLAYLLFEVLTKKTNKRCCHPNLKPIECFIFQYNVLFFRLASLCLNNYFHAYIIIHFVATITYIDSNQEFVRCTLVFLLTQQGIPGFMDTDWISLIILETTPVHNHKFHLPIF